MNELKEYWYSCLEEKTQKDFYNYCLKTKTLCTTAIASALDASFTEEENISLSCIAFEAIEEEIGPLLFNLRKASYPPQDNFDTDQMYQLNQMIKVAEYFEIEYISQILKEAQRIHTFRMEK